MDGLPPPEVSVRIPWILATALAIWPAVSCGSGVELSRTVSHCPIVLILYLLSVLLSHLLLVGCTFLELMAAPYYVWQAGRVGNVSSTNLSCLLPLSPSISRCAKMAVSCVVGLLCCCAECGGLNNKGLDSSGSEKQGLEKCLSATVAKAASFLVRVW